MEVQNEVGWISFCEYDFELFYKLNNINLYNTMWMLRCYDNNSTSNSFVSMETLTTTLSCSKTTVAKSIKLFEKIGLFEVCRGNYYHNNKTNKVLKYSNRYRFTNNVESILGLDFEKIKKEIKNNYKKQLDKVGG